MRVDRFRLAAVNRALKTACATAAVTFVIFCLVNLAVSPWVRSPDQDMELLRSTRADAALSRYGIDFFRRLYPDKSEAEIKKLLYQHSVLETIYEPFAEFRMPAIATDTLNNHEAGFRLIGPDQGPWPPDKNAYNVFVFGGSTTWGGGNMDGGDHPRLSAGNASGAGGYPAYQRLQFWCRCAFLHPRGDLLPEFAARADLYPTLQSSSMV